LLKINHRQSRGCHLLFKNISKPAAIIDNIIALTILLCRHGTYNQLEIINLTIALALPEKKVNIPVTLQIGFTVRLRPIS